MFNKVNYIQSAFTCCDFFLLLLLLLLQWFETQKNHISSHVQNRKAHLPESIFYQIVLLLLAINDSLVLKE